MRREIEEWRREIEEWRREIEEWRRADALRGRADALRGRATEIPIVCINEDKWKSYKQNSNISLSRQLYKYLYVPLDKQLIEFRFIQGDVIILIGPQTVSAHL